MWRHFSVTASRARLLLYITRYESVPVREYTLIMEAEPPAAYPVKPTYDGDPPVYYPPPPPTDQQLPPPVFIPASYGTGQPGGEPVEDRSHVLSVEPDAGDQQENNAEDMFKFSEKSVRLGFIKKVFGLLFFQLLITAGIMCIFIFVEPVKEYLIRNSWVYITSIVLAIVVTLAFGFATKARRMWPWNIIGLLLITLVMSTMLGSIAATMDVVEVLISVGIVAFVVAICAILGVQSKLDFTPMIGFLFIFGSVLFAFAFLSIFFYSEIMAIVYSALGALLFALWLLFDMQMILGGKHKLRFDPEDYVGGSLTLYVDIVYMLLMIFFIFKAT